MNCQFLIMIFLASAILGCNGPAPITANHQKASQTQVSSPTSPFSADRIAGHYQLGNGRERKNLHLNLRDDSTFRCQWFDYGNRGCAGGEVRGECSGSWEVERNLIRISNRQKSGCFNELPLGNFLMQPHGIVQVLVQTNDREKYDKRPNDENCFRKNDPNMRRYPHAHEWPESLKLLVENDRQLARDVEPLGFNPIDNCFILETSTNSKLRQKILEVYNLETVSATHPLLATLVHSIPDARLRWDWELDQCNLLATGGHGAAQLDSEVAFAVADHPESNETIVFIHWK